MSHWDLWLVQCLSVLFSNLKNLSFCRKKKKVSVKQEQPNGSCYMKNYLKKNKQPFSKMSYRKKNEILLIYNCHKKILFVFFFLFDTFCWQLELSYFKEKNTRTIKNSEREKSYWQTYNYCMCTGTFSFWILKGILTAKI